MKRTFFRFSTILAVVMFFTAASANAQGLVQRYGFNVPFAFNIGNKTLPAGEYMVSSASDTVTVRSKDGKQTVIVLPAGRRGSNNIRRDTKLTFKQYGDRYYLSQIWLQDNIGRELKKPRHIATEVAETSATIDIAATR